MKRRKYFRVLGVLIGCTLLAGGFLLLLIYNPSWAFPYTVSHGAMVIRSDEPIDRIDAERVLARTAAKLRCSPFYREDARFTVCICNRQWHRRLFFVVQPMAGGLHYYRSRSIFLSGAVLKENRLVSPSGCVVQDGRTLDYFVAHEVTHALAEKAVGVLRYARLPNWISEGYADYVGRGSALAVVRNRQSFLDGGAEMNSPASAPYLRYNLLVGFYLERLGWHPRELHLASIPREKAEAEVRIALEREANEVTGSNASERGPLPMRTQ